MNMPWLAPLRPSISARFIADNGWQGNSANYQVLRLKFSADPSEEDAPSSQELQMTITALSQKVSQLNGSCSTLVQDIVECQWVARSSVFVSAYVRFLGNLVSAHSSYMGMVTRMLVGFFGYRMLPVISCGGRIGVS